VAGPGRTIYVSGCGSIDESGTLVGRGDVAAQTGELRAVFIRGFSRDRS
jgi:hypothetical protein